MSISPISAEALLSFETGRFSQPKSHATNSKSFETVLVMVENERTAGSIPKWQKPQTPEQEITRTLQQAKNTLNQNETLADITALAPSAGNSKTSSQEPFTLGDLVDMVNPLHHIPVLGNAYRALTGDSIKDVSAVVGGAIFTGPVGFAGNLVNTIARHETGKTIPEHIFSDLTSALRTEQQTRLAKAVEKGQKADLPASLLAFTRLS